MFYHLLYPLKGMFFGFNVFKYLTVRSGLGFIISFLLVVILGNRFIKYLRKINLKENIDMYGNVKLEKIYGGKQGTPTMGGLLMGMSILVSVLLCSRLDTPFIWLSLFVMLWFMGIGFIDDVVKLKNKRGLSRLQKLSSQMVGGLFIAVTIYVYELITPTIHFPFLKDMVLNIGIFYVFWIMLVISATCNAVNFTDGLDGLAIGSSIMVALTFGVLSYISGHAILSGYLFLPHIPNSGELAVVCSCIVGAGLGFLWFNSYPAQIFMGDVGSSLIGGMLGAVAVMIHKELWLLIAGGVFVLEALSVIGQIVAVRVFKKRIFKAAPFHHHLRLIGWAEAKVTVRLWIISLLFVAISLMTLKLR